MKFILFVGAGCKGAMDASNLPKPIRRGVALSVPPHEYRSTSKDAALERRFQQVYVDQPSVPIPFCGDWKERYEVHHGVKISDSALVAAALSARYISDRFA